MRHTYLKLLGISAAVLIGWSCEKSVLTLPETIVTSGARLKLIHAAPEAPGVDLLIGGKKFSGFTPAGASTTSPGTPVPITYTRAFPSLDFNYAIVPAGQSEVSLTAPAATTASSATVVSTQNLTLDDNKYYSLFLTGTGPKPEVLLINDDFSAAVDPSKFYVRFINLTPGIKYDLALASGTVLAPNLDYKGVSPFVAVDASNNASFVFRLPGTSVSIGTIAFTNTVNGRVLTVYTRGIVGRTGTVAPAISFYVNR